MYNIQIGIDSQTIDVDIPTMKELIDELCGSDWFLCKSFDGSDIAVHSKNGENITSINQVVEANGQSQTDAA
jgi:hypothetical protein